MRTNGDAKRANRHQRSKGPDTADRTGDADPHALRLGNEVRPLTGLWDGLECFAAYGDDLEPQSLASLATGRLGRAPDAAGLVDHEQIGDAWEAARGKVSIVALLLEKLRS